MCERKPVLDQRLIFWEVGCVCVLFPAPNKKFPGSNVTYDRGEMPQGKRKKKKNNKKPCPKL